MRAAFVAVQSGMQVAVLVPHDSACAAASSDVRRPVRGLAGTDRAALALPALGTLRPRSYAVSRTVPWTSSSARTSCSMVEFDSSAWGLVVIDEEHRFGVRQKERFKALRAEVDVLTLTATPIPRTLDMALSGLRDLSLIATPPAKRLSIQTFVRRWDPGMLREALQREHRRGGQIFFVHNKVEDIERIADNVRELAADAQVRGRARADARA